MQCSDAGKMETCGGTDRVSIYQYDGSKVSGFRLVGSGGVEFWRLLLYSTLFCRMEDWGILEWWTVGARSGR